MALHPLHLLGFEPTIPSVRPRSLADLGFEPATHGISPRAKTATRKTAREPRLIAEMQQSIARTQPVGAIDPASGRKIVQPTDNPAVNQALATDAMPAYKARLLQAIGIYPRCDAGSLPRCQESDAPGGKDRRRGTAREDGKRLRCGADRGRFATSKGCGGGRGETALPGVAGKG